MFHYLVYLAGAGGKAYRQCRQLLSQVPVDVAAGGGKLYRHRQQSILTAETIKENTVNKI